MEQSRDMADRLKIRIVPNSHDQRRRPSFCELGALSLTLPLTLGGCAHSPEYSIFGSFFPAWIFCSLAGLVLMAGTRAVIARTAIAEQLAAPVLFYLSMAVFQTCMLWLLLYS